MGVNMVRKVFKTGNSLVVSLPKEAIQLLALKEGSDVSITVDKVQEQIIIEPAYEEIASVDKAFARQVTEFVELYRPALEALTKQSS